VTIAADRGWQATGSASWLAVEHAFTASGKWKRTRHGKPGRPTECRYDAQDGAGRLVGVLHARLQAR